MQQTNNPITPDEFRDAMIDISNRLGDDVEVVHASMDALMCDVLKSLGYEKGVDVFVGTYKWYA